MASVYSSFVGLTKMLLAKKQFLLRRWGGGEEGKKFNLKEIPTKSEMVPLVQEVRVFQWVR